MRTTVIAVACLAACGPSRHHGDGDKDDDRYTFDIDLGRDHKKQPQQDDKPDPGRYQPVQPQAPDDPLDQGTAARAITKSQPLPPPREECIDNGTVSQVRIKGDRLYACTSVACATWSRATAKYIKTEALFAVEADDDPNAAVPVDPPDPDADDARVTLDGETVQACPEDRICMRFMPLVKDGESIDSVRGDAKHRAVAVTITGTDAKDAHVEVWDLDSGRLKGGRTKFTGLDPEQTYSFQTRAYGDAFVTFAKRDDNSRATASLFGLDGTRRAMLTGGSGWIHMDNIVEPAPGQLALLDMGAPGKPYNVYVHALPSGGVISKTTIPMLGTDDDVSLVKMEHGMLGVAQWKSDSGNSPNSDAKLRVDVIDPRAGSHVFIAPGC